MKVAFEPQGIRKAKASEHATRFVFGAVVTVTTGLVAHRWGAEIGGLCLAFPAILPATLTLVKDHDGRTKACDDARGARLGAVGLVAFAVVVALLAKHCHPAFVLAAATTAWAVTSVTLWFATRPSRPVSPGADTRRADG